jgi:hypothetical protein
MTSSAGPFGVGTGLSDADAWMSRGDLEDSDSGRPHEHNKRVQKIRREICNLILGGAFSIGPQFSHGTLTRVSQLSFRISFATKF